MLITIRNQFEELDIEDSEEDDDYEDEELDADTIEQNDKE